MRTESNTEAEPPSRRPSHALRAILLAPRATVITLVSLAAIGCSSTKPAPTTDSATKSTTIAAAAPEPAPRPIATANPTPDPAPTPRPAPAPAIKPVETFDLVWETVRDQHFDKTLNGVDWNAVRAEFLPKVQGVGSQDELRLLLAQMLERLGQSHFGVIPAHEAEASPTVETQEKLADAAKPAGTTSVPATAPTTAAAGADNTTAAAAGGPGIAGLDIALVDNAPTVIRVTAGLPASRAGVLVGWELVSVDGMKIADRLQPIRDAIAAERDPGSTHGRQLRTMLADGGGRLLSGAAGERCRAVFRDASGAEQEVTIAFEPAPLGSTQFGNLPAFPIEVDSKVTELSVEGGQAVKVGYLSFNIWMTGASEAIEKAIDTMRGCDGIVIDLRGNPGGVGAMSMGIAGQFLSAPASLGSMIGRDSTLGFNASPRKVSAAGKRVKPISRPLAIIVDARSASTSEVFAGGMQDIGRARIFGETSAGMALPARALELPNGDVLLHAVADFTTPKGTRIEGRGVVPDTEVSLTRAGLLTGHDAVFDSAAQWIREQTIASRAAKPTASATAKPTPRERAAARTAAAAAASVTRDEPTDR
jgi:carboxyl-terminal processing protease